MTRTLLALLTFVLVATTANGQTSPDNTKVPPAPYIIDAKGLKWGIGLNGKPGDPSSLTNVNLMAYCGGVVYARIPDGTWYKGSSVGASWTAIGKTDPCS